MGEVPDGICQLKTHFRLKEVTMKKFFTICLSLLLVTAAAAVGQTSATLTLDGNMPQILEVYVGGPGDSGFTSSTFTTSTINLNQDTTGSPITVATLRERSNVASYTITVTPDSVSTTSGSPAFLDGSGNTITYTLSVGGNGLSFSGSGTTISRSSRTTAAGLESAIELEFNGTADLYPAGSYSDTVTFDITAP
jgi:hypothetical protein